MKILSSINYYIIIEKYIHTVIVFAWVAVVIVLRLGIFFIVLEWLS